ncbi:MAG TPA: response regulator transcription factor [Candidatus Acetatifactor stercoripullorum]|uniref:Stage 0 sporulation protein A homolog n=1 Tax=Candidatus Acetatifactor stercoripullorum TaxID=2838414 RepID=A0A9D1UBH1_9FIRM|nr:response regulator transcription factor [Candidatus Acetatifactor stercoripullorum]HIW80310.1 response regulator transcription factor [Candidatus Acetatifactor stercoripullorum]
MNTKINILLIEDDKSISGFITTSLERNGYRVTSALNGKEGLSLAASLCPDVILLDLGLPDIDGCEILKQIRSWNSNIPIIILSARTKEQDKVSALDLGADDYLTKPFGTAELMARIRTSMRHRHPASPDRVYRALDLEINFEKRLIRLEGKEVHLTQIEYQLLTLLAENSGRVLTYSYLMNAIWGPYMDSNNQILRVNMANIRRKIEKNPAQPQYVFTEIGIGYRMLENENT